MTFPIKAKRLNRINQNIVSAENWQKLKQSQANVAFPELSENSLFIPAIGSRAPIVYSSTADVAELDQLLTEGVVHIGGTALPGSQGNAVIVGHSSAYVWDKKQKFGTIFTLLDKLKTGDLIWIRTKEGLFAYSVTNKTIVKPTAVEIMDTTNEPVVTLFTCYPIGTTKSRIVVRGRLIYPEKPLKSLVQKQVVQSLPRVR